MRYKPLRTGVNARKSRNITPRQRRAQVEGAEGARAEGDDVLAHWKLDPGPAAWATASEGPRGAASVPRTRRRG